MALTKIKADGLTADLIDETKLADNSIDSEHYNDGSIDNAHLADDAVGVAELSATGTASSSTFLRGDNSWATPTDTNTVTTINNNADNRVITGSGTANTLEGEANLTFDGQTLKVDNTSANPQFHLTSAANGLCELKFGDANDTTRGNIIYRNGTAGDALCFNGYNNTERMRIDADGRIGVGIVPQASQYSGWTILQVGESAALTSNKTTGDTNTTELSNNSYLNSNASAYKYHHNDEASRYTQAHGRHTFFVAGSGSADADISFAEKIRIDSDGVKFNGDTGAAYALDDYEEGNWTPDLTRWTGSAWWSNTWDTAPTTNMGTYTKIGNVVYITFEVAGFDVGSATDGRYAGMNGLPFTSKNSGQAGHLTIVYSSGAFGTNTVTSFWISNNATTTTTVIIDDNGSHNTWESGSNKRIRGQGFYFTS